MIKTYGKYITYECAADILGVRVADIEMFVALTGFPTQNGKFNMIHDSVLNIYRH